MLVFFTKTTCFFSSLVSPSQVPFSFKPSTATEKAPVTPSLLMGIVKSIWGSLTACVVGDVVLILALFMKVMTVPQSPYLWLMFTLHAIDPIGFPAHSAILVLLASPDDRVRSGPGD